MNRTDFIRHIETNYCCGGDFENILDEIEHSDADGDFIFENDSIVIGKYFYNFGLRNLTGAENTLHFCIYGIGEKENITPDDYELKTYENFVYVLL